MYFILLGKGNNQSSDKRYKMLLGMCTALKNKRELSFPQTKIFQLKRSAVPMLAG